MSWKHEVEDCPCAVDECSEKDACRKWCMVDLCSKLQKSSRRMHNASIDGTQVNLEDFEDDLERAYEWLTNHKGKRRTSCFSRKEVRKLQEACDRLRDAYAAEFEDELSDDDDGWVGLEMEIHHVGIPKVDEKEVQKEEKQIIHIEDVVHKNQRPFEEADNVRNGHVDSRMNGEVMDRKRNEEEEVIDLFLDSIENVCRITNDESKQEEVSKVRCTHEEFATTTMNNSVLEELSPRRSTDENMELANLVEILSQQCTQQF
ncbi:hypothetical protein L7F22_015051 [Adiantum nelumboides]|nr:hypothetical protein [Adiantum nelumboides]